MRRITHILATIVVLSLFWSCENFLDVNPKSEVIDKDMFTTAEGYEDALYGLYGTMGSSTNLYGAKLSLTMPEVMGHNFAFNGTTSTSVFSYLASTNWTYMAVKDYIRDVWSDAYKAVSYANNILKHAAEDGDEKYEYSKLYRGEALALRAFIHFDLVRYFGAGYNTTEANSVDNGIRYVSAFSFSITPRSSTKDVYQYILADLLEAEKCLKDDETLMEAVRTNDANGFTSCRILHINLYAVQAMLARVYLHMGNMDKAFYYATKVIDSEKFPLMGTADFTNFENGVLNLKETIWGIYSPTYAEACYKHLTQSSSIGVERSDINELYMNVQSASGATDKRLIWFGDINEEKVNYTCIKLITQMFRNNTEKDKTPTYSGKSFVGANMIRIPEMYLIAAEAKLDTDYDTAESYMNMLAESRGLPAYADRGESGVKVTIDEILQEYKKEFYGEGVLWFQRKRHKVDVKTADGVISGNLVSTYMLPIPIAELEW